MFKKLVAIEPVSLIPTAEEALHQYAEQVELYRDIPADDEEIVRRIGDADAALLSYTSRMGKNVIERCPNLRYIGMCCSLYSEESANVDIAFAREKGIKVLGIRDYGDRGVVEYVLHELTGLLHGFGMPMLHDEPVEIYGLKVGIVGLGVSGRMIADALNFLGADISYYSRSHKPDAEAAGMKYKPLDTLLRESEVVFTCLNKNVLLLGEPEFEALGEGKVLFNTSIGPGFDSAALEKWLDKPGTHFFCDTYAAAGPVSEGFFRRPNVHSPGVSAGRTRQAFVLLSQKVLANIETALGEIAVVSLMCYTPGATTATIAPTACPVFMWTKNPATVPPTAAASWSRWRSGYARAASGRSSTAANAAESSAPTGWRQTTTP